MGPDGLVFAYEPQRVIFQLLCANIALNEAFNVRTQQAACGRAAGTIMVPSIDCSVDGSNYGGVSLRDITEGEAVPLIPLDSLTLPALRLLKIDVEGMERDVIEGAQAQIARHRPVLYVENDHRDRSPQLITMIKDLGYKLWWHKPLLFNEENFAGSAENIFAGVMAVNLLCVPEEQAHTVTGFPAVSGPEDWWETDENGNKASQKTESPL